MAALDPTSRFGALDWSLVAFYLAGTVALGVLANRYAGRLSDFIVAGRSLRSSLGIATMVGSELGLVTVMYSAQTGFTGGFAAFHIPLVAGGVTLLVGLTGFIVVPLRRQGVMTIPEFYERRFGRGVRVAGGAILAAAGVLNMGMFLKAGALFVTGLTGLAPERSNLVMSALIVLVLVYTVLGGMVSVVLTDYAQFVVLAFGLLVTTGLALRAVGWDTIVAAVREVHGAAGFDPTAAGAGFGPSYVVWQFFVAGLVSCAVWPTAVARALSAESTAVVRRLYAWSSIGFAIRFLVPQFLGLCALAWFWNDPAARPHFFAGGAPVADAEVTMQALPLFLAQVIPPGLIGLVGAGMLAAFMSTHDSYLLAWATVLAQDVAGGLLGDSLSARGRIALARILVVAIGAFLLVWSLWYPLGQNLWDYMAVSGAIYFTGAFALLAGGLYWPRASRTGAYLALAGGLAALGGLRPVRLALGLDALDRLAGVELGAAHWGLLAATLSLAGLVLGSLLVPDRPGGRA